MGEARQIVKANHLGTNGTAVNPELSEGRVRESWDRLERDPHEGKSWCCSLVLSVFDESTIQKRAKGNFDLFPAHPSDTAAW